jgi:hypothetical protein
VAFVSWSLGRAVMIVDRGGCWWQWRHRDARGALWTTVVVTINLGVVCENGFHSGHSIMILSG